MKKFIKNALMAACVLNAGMSTSHALDLNTQIDLLATHMKQVRQTSQCSINLASLPAPFYGVLDEALDTLSKPCAGDECEAWAKNSNGKRLPDSILYLLKADINAFHEQQNLSILQWNMFFFRVAMHLSLHPERGYHPITEIQATRSGVVSEFLDKYYKAGETLHTKEAFDDILRYQNQTMAFFDARPMAKGNCHMGFNYNLEYNMMMPQYYAQDQWVFSLWNQNLTIEDINHMNALDIFPLGIITELEIYYDGDTPGDPHSFWDHDLFHANTQKGVKDREKFKQIYEGIVALKTVGDEVISLPALNHFSFGKSGGKIPLSTALHTILFIAYHEVGGFGSSTVNQRLVSAVVPDSLVFFEPVVLDADIIRKPFASNEVWGDGSNEQGLELHKIFKLFANAFMARFSHLVQ